jgi:hypothetical protein
MPVGAGKKVSESARGPHPTPSAFVIPGGETRSDSETRNPAARESANLSRVPRATIVPEQIAFGTAGSRPSPG